MIARSAGKNAAKRRDSFGNGALSHHSTVIDKGSYGIDTDEYNLLNGRNGNIFPPEIWASGDSL
jgi:hypothetical protein